MRINVKLNKDNPIFSASDETLSKAVNVKKLHNEPYEEAWERVLSMKNSKLDQERLKKVKEYMDDGKIERDSEKTSRKFSKSEALSMYEKIKEIEREAILNDMVANMPSNYELVTSRERLDEVVNILMRESIIVFDVETTGVDVWSDKIVGHVLSATNIDQHFYIPTDHEDTSVNQLDREYVAVKLSPIYSANSIKKIAHNAKFDIQMLCNDLGIRLKGLHWDTQEAQKLLNENERTYALKPLVSKYLRDKSYTYGDLFGDKPFSAVPLDQALAYASKDGDVTWRLYEFQRHHMSRLGNVLNYFETVEMPLMTVVNDIELMGYEIDVEYAESVANKLRQEADQMEREIVDELNKYFWKVEGNDDEPINIGSPTQLRKAIEGVTGTKAKSADKATLKSLAKKGYDVFGKILEFRDRRKLLSTYYDALPQLINADTGRIHTRLNQNGAKTGRFSSGGSGSFNIQNQSGEAREMFVAPEGKLIVNADFAAQEVRIIASESGEEVLLDAFARGVDAYATLASKFFNKPYEQCYKLPNGDDTPERKKMKVVLLMSMYGASDHGLAQALGISKEEAKKFLEDFFDTYDKIARFIDETNAFAKQNGYVWIGDKVRKRRLPEATWERKFIPYGKWNDPAFEKERIHNGAISKASRQGPNAKIQGLAAVQTKYTMLEMAKLCEKKGWEIFAPVHDEIILYTDDNLTEEDFVDINKVMTQTFLLDGVDNGTDIEVQRRWGKSITAEDYLKGVEVPS